MKSISSKRKFFLGFTFVEVMVTVSIIIILTAVAFSLSGKNKGQAEVTNACNEVASLYNKTRNYALTGKTVSGSVPSYFKLRILSTDNTKASIYYRNAGLPDAGPIESISFPEGVSCGAMGYSGGSSKYNSLYFTVPSGDAITLATASPDEDWTGGSIDCIYCTSYKTEGTCNTTIKKSVEISNFKAECK